MNYFRLSIFFLRTIIKNMIKGLLASVVLIVTILVTFYVSVNYFEAFIYSEANVENNLIIREFVHYKPLMLYYQGNYYIFYTINSTEPLYIKDITSTNGNPILYINKYTDYTWNISRIYYNGEKTLLYVQLGNTQGYVVGKSQLTPLVINEVFNVWATRSQVHFSGYNQGNIPVYFLYVVISGYEALCIHIGNCTMLYYQYVYRHININSWEFPGNYYRGDAYFVNLTSFTITLYYKDVLGENSVSHYINVYS